MAEKEFRCRTACFTLNNYTQGDIEYLKASVAAGNIEYLIFQQEIGENKTPHLQGYVEFSRAMNLGTIKKELTGNKKSPIHIEARKGTAKEASDYCEKNDETTVKGTCFKWGNLKGQGKRTDLKKIAEDIKLNGLKAAIEEHPDMYLKMPRGMKELDKHYKDQRVKVPPYVHWYYGETGTGKSKDATIEAGESCVRISGSLQWFDPYQGEDSVILDDFRGDWCKLHTLLQVLDIYDIQVPIKGGFVHWTPRQIFITSSKTPEECYKTNDENMQQLLRRIHEIRFYYKPGKYITKKNEKPLQKKDNEKGTQATSEEELKEAAEAERQRMVKKSLYNHQENVSVAGYNHLGVEW